MQRRWLGAIAQKCEPDDAPLQLTLQNLFISMHRRGRTIGQKLCFIFGAPEEEALQLRI